MSRRGGSWVVLAATLILSSLFPGPLCEQPLPHPPPSSTSSHAPLPSLTQWTESPATVSQSKPFLSSDVLSDIITAAQWLITGCDLFPKGVVWPISVSLLFVLRFFFFFL